MLKRAPARISHPFVLLGACFWLLNDLVFKQTCPGIITGKLSDFCGVFVAPFVFAAPFRLLFPDRQRLAQITGIGLVALFMILLKASPETNSIVNHYGSWGIADPGDLISLVMIVPALMLMDVPVPRFYKPAGVILSILACFATSPGMRQVRLVSIPSIDVSFSRSEGLFFVWYPDRKSELYKIRIFRDERIVKELEIKRNALEEREDERIQKTYLVYRPNFLLSPGEYSYEVEVVDIPPAEHRVEYQAVSRLHYFRILP
ncbi:MAG: hypothetical protein K8S54_21590 [Spirochaetia bacterium]|nr:hypothetical protein [Spirochaetia bacterium]